MNIKRAFLVLAAALLMPGLAMAGTTAFAVFHVGLHFNDQNPDATANVNISCDGGLPLSNTSATPLGDDDDVNFLLQFPELGAGSTTCTVWVDDIPGYTAKYNHVHGDSGTNWDRNGCIFTNVDDGHENYCPIHMRPDKSYLRVHKIWNTAGNAGDLIDYETDIFVCTEREGVIRGDNEVRNRWCVDGTVIGPDPTYFDVTFDGASHGGDLVYIAERTLDSAIEVDITNCVPGEISTRGAFRGGLSYEVFNGDGDAPGTGSNNCTITNTVFFEGIPTLNQYGLAIMALLMLGVGFVGFRRFV